MNRDTPPRLVGKKEQVRHFVLEQIAAGLKADDQIWTEHTYADQLQVSKSTVRKAVEEMVAAGVIYQVQGRGTFVKDPDHPLVVERKRQSIRLIGYVSPFIHDDRFMREISLGIEETLDGDQYLLLHKHIHVPEMEEADVLPKLAATVHGIILFSTMTARAHEVLGKLHEQRFPIVFIDRYPQELNANYVVSDNEEVGIMATEHLLSLGHRDIVHVTYREDVTSVDERAEGYCVAMRRAGLKPRILNSNHSHEELPALVERMLSEDPPTGIFCVNDATAIHLCNELKARGVQVPGRMSVVGVDDNPDAAQYEVPLTTIAQSKYQMGARAAKLLVALMTGKTRAGKGIFLQPKLVQRASTIPFRS